MPILSNVWRNSAAAGYHSLKNNAYRTFLSSLGVLVGTTAVVLLVSIALGVRADITNQVKDLGVNVLVVVPGRIDQGTFNPNLGGFSYLRAEFCPELEKVPGVLRAIPFTFVGGGIRRGQKTAIPLITATTPGWFIMHPVELEEGRILTAQDETKDVCVLGSIAKQALFGNQPAAGATVTINGRSFTVIGVTKEKSGNQSLFSFGSFQNLVYLPFQRMMHLQPDLPVMRLMVQSKPDAEPKQLIKQLNRVLLKYLDPQQFQVLTEEDLLGLVYRVSGILTWLLIGLTSIALFVGAVGIMTVMLLGISERSTEIGIRKASGASRRAIFAQFLTEAVITTLIGTVAGLIFSGMVDLVITRLTPIHPELSAAVVGLAVLSGFASGVVFGVYPAVTAAKKDPVSCLRY